MYHNSGVITLSTAEANRLIHPDWTFSSLPSLCFILSCPKRAFTSIYFRCVLPKQTAFISLKGHNISSCITLADIFVPSPDTTALSLSVSLVSTQAIKRWLQYVNGTSSYSMFVRCTRLESFERLSLVYSRSTLAFMRLGCEMQAVAKAWFHSSAKTAASGEWRAFRQRCEAENGTQMAVLTCRVFERCTSRLPEPEWELHRKLPRIGRNSLGFLVDSVTVGV